MQYNLVNILVHLVVDPGNAPHDADEAVGVVPVQGVPIVQSKNKGTLKNSVLDLRFYGVNHPNVNKRLYLSYNIER